jgi:hypothetical protein
VRRRFAESAGWYDEPLDIRRFTAATIITTAGFGLAGLGVASLAEAAPPAPLPDYHWCPGQFWDQGWGHNWDMAAATITTTSTASPATQLTGTVWAIGTRDPS